MQQEIHPAYAPIQVTCSCGNKFSVGSTLGHSLHIDVCNQCHPFYTGQKREAVSGQIEKFRNRFKASKASTKQKPADKQKPAESA